MNWYDEMRGRLDVTIARLAALEAAPMSRVERGPKSLSSTLVELPSQASASTDKTDHPI